MIRHSIGLRLCGGVAAVLASLTAAACAPTPPTPITTTTSSAPSVTSIAVSSSTPSPQTQTGQTVQLVATATLSDGTTQTVTDQATWETSDTSVATVSSTGSVSLLAAGDVEVRASYRSVTGSIRFTVSPAPKPRHRLSGRLTDPINGRGVDQARVEIINGVNAGRSVTTPVDGSYEFADLIEDTFTLRFTSPFYETAERAVTLNADTRVDLVMTPNPDVTRFYGTYNISLRVNQQNCEFPVTPGATGTLSLGGSKDGTTFTATIVERGTSRSYGGRMNPDGNFNGRGGGVIAGIARALVDRASIFQHDYSGDMAGRVTGNSVTGVENVFFGVPCPGKTLQIGFNGSR